jgi:D-glycero-D-manno-heptose 1,7-bisphosphate phosphatase
MSGARALFLDRDGTLMEEVDYCADPAKVRVYPGVPEALRRIKQAGWRTFIVTNQSGIGRGLMTEAQYRAVQDELSRQLGADVIDAAYFCPDLPGTPSTRRKPAPGMVLEAAAEHGIDLPNSFLVGDKSSDIECGQRAGVRTILVLTGYGAQQRCSPDFVATDFPHAVAFALQPPNARGPGGAERPPSTRPEEGYFPARTPGRR